MVLLKVLSTAFAAAPLVGATPCPFKMMESSGAFHGHGSEVAAKLARDPEWIAALDPDFALMKREAQPKANPKAEPEPQLGSDPVGGILGLPLGGGLLGNGALAPLTGILAGVDVPTPQPQGLAPINGDLPGHEFQYPGPTDVRGVCPTLNTLANHGFLSRDGITSFADAANAVQTAYGFGYDLSVFLSALGLIAGGDLPTGKYTIGGADARVPNTLGPALGLDKHGTFEIDGSISRQDDYFGNQASFILDRWNALNDIATANGGQFGFDTFSQNQIDTYNFARANNPSFFAGAKYFVVSLAERVFVFNGLPNGTDEANANFANIAPFFLNETFPEDWFRRADAFSLLDAVTQALALFGSNPFALGANEGGVAGNFIPLDTTTPATPQEFLCFALQNVFDVVPGDVQPTLLANLDTFSGFVDGVMAPLVTSAAGGCPQLTNYTVPSANANSDTSGSTGAPGSPVNGVYPAS